MSVSHQLEGDGILINIYYYLWKKKLNTLESALNVKIPSTVVYEHNFPKGWYYWSDKKDEIERKVGKEIDTKAVYRELSRPARGMPDVDVVASYLSYVESPESGEAETNVEYFDREGLHEFLTRRARREQGILQKFVPPNGKSNVTVQAVWSPHVTLVEKRQNINALNDKRFGLTERVATYDGPSHYSREAFVAPHIQSKVKDICQSFTDHFQNTEHVRISRMVLYFKVDKKCDVWLLWSSSLRISDKTQLNLAPKFITPRPPPADGENHYEHAATRNADGRLRPLSARVMSSHLRDPIPDIRPATARLPRRSPRHREAIHAARAGWAASDAPNAALGAQKDFEPAALAFPSVALPQPPRKPPRSGRVLWGIARLAYKVKFTDVLAAEDHLREFVTNLAYNMYSHFLTHKSTFFFSMAPLLVRFFGEQFAQRFAAWGVERAEETYGEFLITIPKMSLVHLQKELYEWCEQVTRPLVENERALFMDQVRKSMALRGSRGGML